MSDAPLHHRNDPHTSREAGRRAREFREDHESMIVGVAGVPGTIYDFARRCGLDHVQVARRLGPLTKPIHEGGKGLLIATGETRPSPSGHQCTVYRQTTYDERSDLAPDLFA